MVFILTFLQPNSECLLILRYNISNHIMIASQKVVLRLWDLQTKYQKEKGEAGMIEDRLKKQREFFL